MDSSLINLRNKLRLINLSLFELIQERRSIVSAIQKHKQPGEFYPNWDCAVEMQLIKELQPHLIKLNDHELLAFSILMQSQASLGDNANYPNWLGKIHLNNSQEILLECINPTMIYVLRPEYFKHLELKESFKKVYDQFK
jgi:chorismate mutase